MDHSADFLAYLAGVSLRSVCMAAVTWMGLRTCRVRSAPAKHAVWTMVTIAMLAQAAVSSWLPSVPLRVLSAIVTTPGTSSFAIPLQPVPQVQQDASASLSWSAITLALYSATVIILLGRFVLGCLFIRRVIRSSRLTEAATAVAKVRESRWISVPMTVGWLSPKILLPISWREWDAAKLRAVLAHEEAHVRRADWAIGILARINCCLFWFNPLTWWLKRELAALAEYACDDAALAILPNPQDYAKALLDMAYALKSAHGRFVWEALSMAKQANVKKRIDRILDETRHLPEAFRASRWTALVACGVPLAYLASSVQLAPAQSRPQPVQDIVQAQTQVSPAVPAPRIRRQLESPYTRWLDQEVVWIISQDERAAFMSLRTDAEREQFIEQFWLRRDPTPGTDENGFKEEHYRRIAYANDHFMESLPGWNTDRGMIYIRFGPPDTLDTYGGVPGATYPYESWRYRYIEGLGTDVQLEFVDITLTGRYRLTRDPSEKQMRR
jgi:GWxTD domain-containing protein